MRLTHLIESLDEKTQFNASNVDISAIVYDSRKVKPGYLFVATRGFHTDGHSYIGDAIGRGASAILLEDYGLATATSMSTPNVPLIVVPDARKALADVAAVFYQFPSRRLKVVGITGTDGKTTTTFLCSHVLESAGLQTGLMGTVDFKIGDRTWPNDTRQSTPESVEIQQMLSDMVQAGIDYAIIETTSHALALDRVRNVEYDIGIFTNLTSDHLDFHGTRERYLLDKSRLFEMLGRTFDKGVPKVSILNTDDDAYTTLRSNSPKETLTYGIIKPADVMGRVLGLSGSGSRISVATPAGEIELGLKLAGAFNVYNALAAVTMGISQGIGLEVIKQALETVSGVPGRMDVIDCGQPFTVVVDYAHTPESLNKVLDVLRPLSKGKLVVVFGCAGERDKSKRPVMGEIAGKKADFVILANEDPRFENAEAILDQIEVGLAGAGRIHERDYLKIPDRREAIRAAFFKAQPGDLVLLAGKGHEGCIIVDDIKVPWDERVVARELLGQMTGR